MFSPSTWRFGDFILRQSFSLAQDLSWRLITLPDGLLSDGYRAECQHMAGKCGARKRDPFLIWALYVSPPFSTTMCCPVALPFVSLSLLLSLASLFPVSQTSVTDFPLFSCRYSIICHRPTSRCEKISNLLSLSHSFSVSAIWMSCCCFVFFLFRFFFFVFWQNRTLVGKSLPDRCASCFSSSEKASAEAAAWTASSESRPRTHHKETWK